MTLRQTADPVTARRVDDLAAILPCTTRGPFGQVPANNVADYSELLRRRAQFDEMAGFEPLWLPGFLFGFQAFLTEWLIRMGRAAAFADCGLGKGHPAGTRILTPDGWRPIESLTAGDAVIGSAGLPVEVLGLHDRGDLNVCRVTFRDGASVVVDGDHLWTVKTMNDRARDKAWRTIDTRTLMMAGLEYGANRAARYHIPMVAPVQFKEQDLSIDPYLLGALLGDGGLTSGSVVITAANPDVVREVQSVIPGGYALREHSGLRGPSWRITQGRGHPNAVINALRQLGLWGLKSRGKFVPDAYLLASVSQRTALLQGLMDTDGEIRPDGLVAFGSTSRFLAGAVQFLAESLGGSARLTEKRPGVYNVTIACPEWLTPVRAKASSYKPRSKYQPTRPLVNIEPAGRAQVFCLSVDAPDQLYVTERFIVTHNSPMALTWAQNVHMHTGKPVLLQTPLGVTSQMCDEAAKFGIEAAVSRKGEIPAPVTVTNYERLHHFDRDRFGGVVCDESSCLKSFDGKRRALVTDFLRKMPYRLLATATAAPNDYAELGTSSEALGYLGHVDMLSRLFTRDPQWRVQGHGAPWRFKGHAEQPFWRYVASWARAARRPSDLGFPDDGFILPPLEYRQHVVEPGMPSDDGTLFDVPATGLREEREEERRSLRERCEKAAELLADASPGIAWCHRNAEGDLLEKVIPGAVQVSGSDPLEAKEERLAAFARGEIRVLVSKPSVAGWGLNWQHCHRMTYFPSHSFEAAYQAVRRCWRFGQQHPVTVDLITTPGGSRALESLQRKAAQADRMFDALVAHMRDAQGIRRAETYDLDVEVPSWAV